MNRLEFFDLTNLPLISVLRRHQNVLLLLVNAAAYFKPKEGSTQTPVVAKLFPTKQSKLSRRTTLAQLESIKDDDELERADRAFHRELLLLASIHSGQQRNRGVVKLLGWGIAENYSGYLMENIAGPTLSEASSGWCKSPGAGLWKVYPPAHLQILYRLHWALQLANVVYDLHCRNIVHRDLRMEQFAFRSPPSPVTFGELVLTDLAHARFRKTHVDSMAKLPPLSEASRLDLEPSHPCVDLHSDTMMRWRYLAESLIEEFYCDCVPLSGRGGSRSNGAAIELSAEMCMHWPVQPPRVSPPATVTAPELAFCESNGNCPHRCQAEAMRQRAALKQRYGHNLAGRCSLTPRKDGEINGSGGVECKCPICQCHESRCDVWSLGILLGDLFQVFDSESPRIDECTICGNRSELNGANIDSWLEDVAVLVGAMSLPKSAHFESAESRFLLKDSPSMDTTESLQSSMRAVSAQDFFRPKSTLVAWQQSGDCSPLSAKSTQASTPPSHSPSDQLTAVTQLLQWREVGQLVKLKILDVLYWTTESDPSNRITLVHVRDTLEMLFDIVYEFYQELHLPNIYPSRI